MLEKIIDRLKDRKKKNFYCLLKKYKWYLLIFSINLCLFLIFLAFKPVLFKSWLDYPLDLKAEIALEYYRESFNDTCLRTCLEERENLGKIIILAWREDKDYWQEKIFSYLRSSNNIEEKKALVNLSIYVYANDNIAKELKDLVYNENFSYELRHYIIRAYSSSFVKDNDLYLDLISSALNNELAIVKRQSALITTSAWNDYQLPLHILASQEGNDIKESALDLINSFSLSELSLKEDDILLIAQLASEENFNSNLRVKLIWLLSEYYNLYPTIVSDTLIELYNNSELDNISRGFSAQALNYLRSEDLEIPEISQSEWDNYYLNY